MEEKGGEHPAMSLSSVAGVKISGNLYVAAGPRPHGVQQEHMLRCQYHMGYLQVLGNSWGKSHTQRASNPCTRKSLMWL